MSLQAVAVTQGLTPPGLLSRQAGARWSAGVCFGRLGSAPRSRRPSAARVEPARRKGAKAWALSGGDHGLDRVSTRAGRPELAVSAPLESLDPRLGSMALAKAASRLAPSLVESSAALRGGSQALYQQCRCGGGERVAGRPKPKPRRRLRSVGEQRGGSADGWSREQRRETGREVGAAAAACRRSIRRPAAAAYTAAA